MKMKKFIKEIRNEQHDIPEVYDKVKKFAYEKEFSPKTTYSKIRPFSYKKLIIALTSIALILVPATLGLHYLRNSLMKNNSGESQGYYSEIASSDMIDKKYNYNGRKKKVTIDNKVISYPSDLSYSFQVNNIWMDEDSIYWINNYLSDKVLIDIYHLDHGNIEKIQSIETPINSTVKQTSIHKTKDLIVLYVETNIHTFYLYNNKSYKLEGYYEFKDNVCDYFIQNDLLTIVLETSVQKELNYQYNNQKQTINCSKVKVINNIKVNKITTVLQINLSNQTVKSLILGTNKIQYVYHSDKYLYLVTNYYLEKQDDYQCIVYRIELSTLTLDGSIIHNGYVFEGTPLIEEGEYIYLFVQEFNSNKIVLLKYKNNNFDQLLIDSQVIINEGARYSKINVSVTNNELAVDLYDYSSSKWECIIDYNQMIIVQEERFAYIESAYETDNLYVKLVKSNISNYDDTKINIYDKKTGRFLISTKTIYEYYFNNYLKNYFSLFSESQINDIKQVVKVITDGSYEIKITDQEILIPVIVERVVNQKVITMIDYWKFKIEYSENSIMIEFNDIISSYDSTRLSNLLIPSNIKEINGIYEYGIIAGIYKYQDFYYTFSPYLIVSYKEAPSGKLRMYNFIENITQ